MTDKEAEEVYNSYLDWKSEQLKPYLDKREKALKALKDAQQKYFAASAALNRHEANPMFVNKLEREYGKAGGKANRAVAEYDEALDKYSLTRYLKEKRNR